jgi:hypothetical protein
MSLHLYDVRRDDGRAERYARVVFIGTHQLRFYVLERRCYLFVFLP